MKLYMSHDRFVEICVEEGMTATQAEVLWLKRPADFNKVWSSDESSLRETVRERLEKFKKETNRDVN